MTTHNNKRKNTSIFVVNNPISEIILISEIKKFNKQNLFLVVIENPYTLSFIQFLNINKDNICK